MRQQEPVPLTNNTGSHPIDTLHTLIIVTLEISGYTKMYQAWETINDYRYIQKEKKDGNKDIKVKGTNINNISHKGSANFETITENHII